MRSQGVAVPEAKAASSFSLKKEVIETLSGAWMGPPDAEGYCYVVLGWADEDLCGAWIAHVGGGQGVREEGARFIPTSRSGWRRLTHELRDAAEIASVPFAAVLGLALEGVETFRNLTGRLPPDWQHFSAVVPEGTTTAAGLIDPLADVTPSTGEFEGEALKRFAGPFWEADPDSLVEASHEILDAARSELEISDEVKAERQAGLERSCGAAMLAPGAVRLAWRRRAERVALWSHHQGEPDIAAEAAQLAQLLDDGVSGGDIPFVRWAAFQITLRALAEAASMHSEHAPAPHDPLEHHQGHVHGPDCNHD
jgi:hypothetical protein